MTALTLLRQLQNQGIEPQLRDGRLKLVGPASRITPDLVAEARRHKAELLKLVADPCERASAIGKRCELASRDLVDYAGEHAQGLLNEPERLGDPAKSLIDTCRQHGVGLRVDPDGTLVVESYGCAWRSLVEAIGAHADEIANVLLTTGDGQQMSVRRAEA